eukprot:128857_1
MIMQEYNQKSKPDFHWVCAHCTFANSCDDHICTMCKNEQKILMHEYGQSSKPEAGARMTTGQYANDEQCCNIPHNSQQTHCYRTADVHIHPKNQFKKQYRPVKRSLIKCIGDCGSQTAKFLEQIINGQSKHIESEISEYQAMITIMFWNLHDPLRQLLLKLMRKRGLFNEVEYEQYYDLLNDEKFHVSDAEHVRCVINLFKALIAGDHLDILQHIASQTCRDPSWSLLEQIIYGPLYTLQDEYNTYKRTISMLQGDHDAKENQVVIQVLQAKANKKMKAIEKERTKIEKGSTLKRYIQRLETVKQHYKHKQMQQHQDSELNDLEILAILFYCDEDQYCAQMHKSHYTESANSCKWSNLFYHMCSGIDKMWRIFHYRQRGNPQYLLSGSTAHLTDASQHELHLKTLTSFTASASIAKDFAQKKGTVMAINDADKALAEGKLRGADVSWISKHNGEDEYVILPTTFRDFKYMSVAERVNQGWWELNDDYHVYISSNVESIHMSSFITDIEDKFDPPLSWIPHNLPYYKDVREAVDSITIILGSAVGVCRSMSCPVCNGLSRIFHYSGAWSDLSVECPSCRSLIIKSGRNDNRNRTFKCANTECKSDMISMQDLKQVSQEEHGLDPDDGYQCTYCGAQQKKVGLERRANDCEWHAASADRLVETLNKLMYLNSKHNGGRFEPLDTNEYKQDLMNIISFLHQPENDNASLVDIVTTFPVIWKWITSIKNVKFMLDAYKDGYMDLLGKGMIDTTNDKQMENEKYKQFGAVIRNEMSKIESVQDVIDIAGNILDEVYVNNTSGQDSDDGSDDKIYCDTCGEEMWELNGNGVAICTRDACVSRTISSALSSFGNLFRH